MADRCWRCGTETLDGDSFCRSCGARVSASAPDLELITDLAPTPAGPVAAASAKSQRWPLVVGVALIGVLIAVFALPNADEVPSAGPTDPQDPADPQDRAELDGLDEPAEGTDTNPAFPLVDGQLDWQPIRYEADGYPITAVEIDGSLFVYESPSGFPWNGVTGVSIIEYQPTTGTWVDHGLLADDGARVVNVAEIERGVAAIGLDTDGRPTVWLSGDGLHFTPSALPEIADAEGGEVRPQNLVEHGGTMMITPGQESPWQTVTEEIARRTEGLDLHVNNWFNDGETVSIRGPFGLELSEFSLAELGVDADDLAGPPDDPLPVWVDDGDGWRIETLDAQVFGVRGLPDGSILVTTLDESGMTASAYQSGEWQNRTLDVDRFVGVGPDGAVGVTQDHTRLVELDGDFGITRYLAMPVSSDFAINDWHIDTDGILVALSRWDAETELNRSRSDRVVLIEGDYRLVADGDHLLELEHNGDLLRTINTWSSDASGYQVDLDADVQTVTFLDEQTGTPLVTFELADIIELERASQPPAVFPTQAVTTAFTPGDDRWFVGDLAAGPFDTSAFVRVQATGDQLFAFVTAARDGSSSATEESELMYTIHAAPVPG